MSVAKNHSPSVVLAFDIFGTLIDTDGVVQALQRIIGAGASEFAALWRAKQLEYTFRYAAMQHYRDFRACTEQALSFCCETMNANLDADARAELMGQYAKLPAFAEVPAELQKLANGDMKLVAFSNGRADDVREILSYAGIGDFFADIISVDEISTFKPAPAVYRHLLKRTKTTAEKCYLISSNAFDICGARAIGMRALWLRRSPQAKFDAWEFSPTAEINSLAELSGYAF